MFIQKHPMGGVVISLGWYLYWDMRTGYVRSCGKVRRWGHKEMR